MVRYPAPASDGRPSRGRPVRVCFLIDRLSVAGTETQLLALIRNLDRERVEPILCLKDGEDEESRSLEPVNCPVYRLGIRSILSLDTPGRLVRFARILRRDKVDVLQLYFQDSTYVGLALGMLARIPYIVRTRNNVGYWMTSLHRRLLRMCTPFVSALVANCEAARQSAIAQEGFPVGRTFVLENGTDLARFPVPGPPRWNRSPGPKVGIVANLRAVKGIDVFIRAAAQILIRFPRTAFLVAGEGPLRPALEGLIKELDLQDHVCLRGCTDNVPEFLADLDVAVLSSNSEAMSNALLEYMAAGKAIVATTVGANSHLIHHEKHGLLVPPGDSAALARAIERLLDNRCLAERCARAARARVEQCFSRGAAVRRFEDFYFTLLGRRGP
jgi:glycosyltransferase involved in cell wall biosynthesis